MASSGVPYRDHRRGPRLLVGLSAFSWLVFANLAGAWEGDGPAIARVRLGFDATSKGGASNSFKVGSWVPVWIELKGGRESFQGVLDVAAADDDGVPASLRTGISMAAGETLRLITYARPGARDPDLRLVLTDPQGRRRASAVQANFLHDPPRALKPGETLILTTGRPAGVETIIDLPGFRAGGLGSVDAGGSEFVTAALDVAGERLPDRWYGYDAAWGVVVDANDRQALEALSGPRGQALVDWVARGGHLVVAVGSQWQAVKSSPIGSILPCVPNGQESVPSLEALDAFAGSTKPITPPETPAVRVARLENVAERGGSILSITSNLPLVVRGSHGFGRVTVIAIDVDQQPFSTWADRGMFWIRALDLRGRRVDPSAVGAKLGGGGTRFYQANTKDLSSQLKVALEQFPGVTLVPFGWIAFAIFLYIALIGPGDYFLLRKVFKRMEFTWITFPAVVAAVGLVAYFAAYRLKGDELLINKVDVIDIDQIAGVGRGCTWFTLFSPRNQDYAIEVTPTPLDAGQPVAAGSARSKPSPETKVLLSWASAPDDRFGSMGSSSRRFSFGGGGYSYEPAGEPERLENVRIPIWSTKGLQARWFGPAQPVVESDLTPIGTDRLLGVVQNRLDVPLEDAILAFGKHVYELGTLVPGSTIRVELAKDRNLSGYLHTRQGSYVPDATSSLTAPIDRGDLLMAAMFHDSETTSSGVSLLTNDVLHDLDLTGQLALSRPMLAARIKRAGSRVVLEGGSSDPRTNQVTLLRVVLPLRRTQP